MEAPHVLLIDDNPDDRALVAREIRRALPNAILHEITDDQQFRQALRRDAFDLVVTDYALKWTEGLSVLRAIKSNFPDVAVIMFTGTGNQEIAVEAMKEGLDDYIVKSPAHFVRLRAASAAALRRRAAARRAQLLELRQLQLLNRLSIGVFRATLDGRLLESNPALLRILAVQSLPEALELDLAPLRLPPAELQRLRQLPPDAGHHALWEVSLHRADRKNIWATVNATLSTMGDEIVADCLLEDVTERRQIIQELEQASRAKDEFLAVLSHELRTPLTPVLSIASMLEKLPDLPERVREDIALIRRNAELEVRLIDDLLDLTRVAKGKLLLDLRPVDVHSALRRAWQTCCPPDAARQNLNYQADLRAARYTVFGDEGRLQQVFMNIMTNAVKFSHEGGTITTTTRNADSAIVIEITDTGIGMEPELLARIFNAFEQGQFPNHRSVRGLGLGLSIARRLIDLHKGAITAASDGRNQGARFTITLPLYAAAEHPPAAPANGHSASARRNPLRILLVEDHADTARAIKRLLEMLGHSVDTAGSIAAALHAIDNSPPTLVISDLGLPDGHGTELAQQLQSRTPRIPAIALSGFGAETDIQRSRAAGFAAHLTKPVNIDQLERTLNTFPLAPHA
ncbi:MAG: response regulator [Phycisphaerae bacterium]